MQAYVGDAHPAIETTLEISPDYTLKDFGKFHPYRIDETRKRILEDLRETGLLKRLFSK